MVALTSRFVLLAALVATSTFAPLLPVVNAGVLAVRRTHSEPSATGAVSVQTGSIPTAAKGKGKDLPVPPLPTSASHTKDGKDKKKQTRSVEKSMEVRDPEHHHHHHHHHHDRREEAQSALSMQMLKRHHSHHHHHHHDREVQESGLDKRAHDHDHDHDHDNSHDHDHDHAKRSTTHVYLSPANAVASDTWDPLDPLIGIGNVQIGDERHGSYSDNHYLLGPGPVIKREPGHHHHGDHHKIVMTGDNDHVHMHERREPHRHHHHDDKIIMTGDNDHVHIHDRSVRSDIPDDTVLSMGLSLDMGTGDDCEVVHGRYVKCRDDQKRSVVKRDDSGVPGTVDIVAVGSAPQRLASLVLSSVGNSTTNGTVDGGLSKATSSSDGSFVLDASNSTKTQFFLVAIPSKPSVVANGTLAEAFAALNSTSAPQTGEDIKVTLQVPVFNPDKASMTPFCATYDTKPSAPAPLNMMECFVSSIGEDGKSQTFAYNPDTGVVKPLWILADETPSTENNTSVSDSSNSTNSGNSTLSMNATSSLAAHFKALDTIKDTVSSNSTSTPASPQNVTLVFTPAAPAVQDVKDPSDAAAFKPIASSDSVDVSATASASMVVTSSSDSSSEDISTLTDSSMDTDSATTTDTMVATSTSSTDTSDATSESTDVPQETDTQPTSTDTDDTASATTTSATDATSSLPATMSTDTDSGTDTTDSAMPTSTLDASAMEMFQKQPGAGRLRFF